MFCLGASVFLNVWSVNASNWITMFVQRTLGSSGGQTSLEGNVSRKVVATSRK